MPPKILQDESSYSFTGTQDWVTFHVEKWTTLFSHVKSAKPRILEIGSWEGRSAVFLLDKLAKGEGEIVCIDHFDLMSTPAGRERYAKITHNLALTGGRYRILDEFSTPALTRLLTEEISVKNPGYDWIYVDGSHEADDTFLDGELAWRLARKGAIVIFDDYNWDSEPDDSIHHPKRGIDAFMLLHIGEYERLSSPSDYQMILKKTSEMRIGFLVKGTPIVDSKLSDALGYSINICFAADSRYAAPVSVAIRGIVEKTLGRKTIYLVDCGIRDEDKEKLAATIPPGTETTLKFLNLPSNSLTSDYGPVWAKIDAFRILPVERVLYLDADVLVRKSLRPLWEIDLQGKTIGAVMDMGLPSGSDGVAAGPYFNAGVLIIDLARARVRVDELEAKAHSMKDSKFRDQDILNGHFAQDWYELPMTWNAQGLGTYANMITAERQNIDRTDVDNPAIVHFTGPTHPSLADVINPWVQPYTAKPWGYAGAPGHPFANEWWQMLDKTAWKGMKESREFEEIRSTEAEKAIDIGLREFRNMVCLNKDL